MKIGILTTLADFNSAYSLVSVIRDQLEAHVRHNYEIVLFALESFKDDDLVPNDVELRKVVPPLILEAYKGYEIADTFEQDVEHVKKVFEKYLQDIDICITHDIVFIDSFLPYNVALRKTNLPKTKFLHWIHSAPSLRPDLPEGDPHWARYSLPPNSKLVYLNNDKAMAIAEMFSAWLKDVRVVYNSCDPRTFWNLHPLTKKLINKYDLLSADIISVYPVSSTRMGDNGKAVEKVIKIHSKLQQQGLKTKVIIPNAHANADREKKEIQRIRDKWKMPNDLIFTSLENPPKYENGVPRKVVSDLFRLSNVFIFPSVSENCSLVLLEAMLSKNLLVLNKDCSGLQEFGLDNALYFEFGGLDIKRNYQDEEKYYGDIAKIITSELKINRPLQAFNRCRKEFNFDTIFKKMIEPIYFEQ